MFLPFPPGSWPSGCLVYVTASPSNAPIAAPAPYDIEVYLGQRQILIRIVINT